MKQSGNHFIRVEFEQKEATKVDKESQRGQDSKVRIIIQIIAQIYSIVIRTIRSKLLISELIDQKQVQAISEH